MSGGNIKAKRKLQRVWYIGSSVAVIAILVITVGLVALRIFGYQMYTVTSGSMEPNYPVGSLIYTSPVNPNNLKAGDVITFMNSETTVVTHRINELVTESNSSGTITKFRTKGDANDTVDGKLVHPNNIIGSPVVVIPYLGYLSYYLQRPPGLYIALIVCTFLVSLIIIPSVTKNKGKEQTVEQVKAKA